MCKQEWMETSIWVVPQDYKSCPYAGIGLFYFFKTEELSYDFIDETMAGLTIKTRTKIKLKNIL